MARRGSRSQRRLISLVSLAMTLAAVLVPTLSNLRSSPRAEAQTQSTRASQPGPSAASNRTDLRLRRIGFASQRGLDSHWLKHGSEFDVSSKAQYLALAQALRDAPLSSNVLEASQSNGSYARFDRRTGAFLAFNQDLTIRTFFRPDDGESYFRRAVNR
jgi:hypothetical protein